MKTKFIDKRITEFCKEEMEKEADKLGTSNKKKEKRLDVYGLYKEGAKIYRKGTPFRKEDLTKHLPSSIGPFHLNSSDGCMNELARYFNADQVEIQKLLTTMRASPTLDRKHLTGNMLLSWAEELFENHQSWSRKKLLNLEKSRNWNKQEIGQLFQILIEKDILQPKKNTNQSKGGNSTTTTTTNKDGTMLYNNEIKEEFVVDKEIYYVIQDDPATEELRRLKSKWNTKKISFALSQEGMKANFPVILIPGYGASALSVWKSEEKKEWEEERIWIGMSKIGSVAKLKRLESRLKKLGKGGEFLSEQNKYEQSRIWLKHIMLYDDCYSDPPGIKTRPLEGISAVDYLSHSSISKRATYVFGPIIKALKDVGYDPSNLKAAPYDWRLPIYFLEKRDGYFTSLKSNIENLVEYNKKRVVIIAHSMGNRIFQTFLRWIIKYHSLSWIKKYIHAHMALAAPFLGASKSVRGLLSGDTLGLDFFLMPQEALVWNKRTGSLCSLLPICTNLYPHPIIHIREESLKFLKILRYEKKIKQIFKRKFNEEDDESKKRNLPQWLKMLLNYDDGLHEKSSDHNNLPLTPIYLQGNWISDNQRSDSMSGFRDAIDDSHGFRSKIIEKSERGPDIQFKIKKNTFLNRQNINIQKPTLLKSPRQLHEISKEEMGLAHQDDYCEIMMQCKLLLHNITMNKFYVCFDQILDLEKLISEQNQFSWFENKGKLLCTKIPLKRSNMFIFLQLLEKSVLYGRIVICPLIISDFMDIKVYNRYWNKDLSFIPKAFVPISNIKSVNRSQRSPSDLSAHLSDSEDESTSLHQSSIENIRFCCNSIEDYCIPDIYSLLEGQVPEMYEIFINYYVQNKLYLNKNSTDEIPLSKKLINIQQEKKQEIPENTSEDFNTFEDQDDNEDNDDGDEFMESHSDILHDLEFNSPVCSDCPILEPPPVDNLWSIYGTGLDTEVSYYYKVTSFGEFTFDSNMDKFSEKISSINPTGMKIKDGVAYETSSTIQKDNVPNSGDGTVPYVSLSYANIWKKNLKEKLSSNVSFEDNIIFPSNIEIVEVKNSEHREMLADSIVHFHILQYVCTGYNHFAVS